MPLFLFVFISQTICAAAATRIWDGGGADNNWSTAANWSGDAIPTNADDAVFDATSVKNAVVNTPFTISSVSINSSYTGMVMQVADANLTITSIFARKRRARLRAAAAH